MTIQRIRASIKRENEIKTNQVNLTNEDKFKSNIKRENNIITVIKHTLNL